MTHGKPKECVESLTLCVCVSVCIVQSPHYKAEQYIYDHNTSRLRFLK